MHGMVCTHAWHFGATCNASLLELTKQGTKEAMLIVGMGGESGCSKSPSAGGSDIELLRVNEAFLYLVDNEESVLMQHGEFKLVLTRQLDSRLAAVLALVKDVEWPIGEDCPVLKVQPGSYSFYLPGIVYGLAFPDSTSRESLKQLELFLQKYSTYEDHSRLSGFDVRDEEASSDREAAALSYWNSVASKVGVISSGLSWYENEMLRNAGSSRYSNARGEMSPRMMKRVQQARRLSAVSKLFSRALLRGKISNAKHVTNSSCPRAGSRRSRPSFESPEDDPIASVDAFAKVVEAVETTGGRSLLVADSKQHPHPVGKSWTLNTLGLHLLIAAVAASTAIHHSKLQAVPATTTTGEEPAAQTRPGFRPVTHNQVQSAHDYDSEGYFQPHGSD